MPQWIDIVILWVVALVMSLQGYSTWSVFVAILVVGVVFTTPRVIVGTRDWLRDRKEKSSR